MRICSPTQSADTLRIAIVEDDPLFCEAVTTAISHETDMSLLAQAHTLADARLMLQGPQADVLLVDLGLPDGSGIDVIHESRKHWGACDIVVSTMFGDENHVMRSIEAGACGYLLKDSNPAGIIQAVRLLRAGGSPISPVIARQVLERLHQRHSPAAPRIDTALSPREQQVLNLVALGYTYSEIATELQVSRHTVQTFIRRVYRKLQVRSKVEAINAMQHLRKSI